MEFDAWPLEEVRTGIRVNDRIGDVEVNQVGALSHSHEPEQVVPAPNLEFFEHVPFKVCLLYTSPSPRDVEESRMPSSA